MKKFREYVLLILVSGFLAFAASLSVSKIMEIINKNYQEKIEMIEKWGRQDKKAGFYKPEQFGRLDFTDAYMKGWHSENP